METAAAADRVAAMAVVMVEAAVIKGPRGEKRPADVIGAAILVGRITTGEVEDKPGVLFVS